MEKLRKVPRKPNVRVLVDDPKGRKARHVCASMPSYNISCRGDEKQLSDQRTEQGRFGLAVLLKFFLLEGWFLHYHKEVPLPVSDNLGLCQLLCHRWGV